MFFPFRLVLLTLFLPAFSFAQQLQATYKVVQSVPVYDENNVPKQLPLEFTGFLYKMNNKYIYFERPEYLSKLTDGYILIGEKGNNKFTYQPNIDTIQSVEYTDYDSMVLRTRSNIFTSVKNKNIVQHFEPGYYDWMHWKLWQDTKEVNGLHCQKATLNTGSQDWWIVWFCADIPMQANLFNIKNLPGLVVEATFLPFSKNFTLESYTANSTFTNDVFWPKVFDEPFVADEDLKKSSSDHAEKPDKRQKQRELLNNNDQ